MSEQSNRLHLSADELLTTTRAVRKRLDFERPLDLAVIRECLDIALQAPSGSNSQAWQFLLMTDTEKIAAVASYYREAFAGYATGPSRPTAQHADDPGMQATQQRVLDSASYLAENLHRVPAMLIPILPYRFDDPAVPSNRVPGMFGSIIPAAWSFMLAARERGVGTCWTTLHLQYEREIGELLGIPPDHSQVAMIPMAYTLGTDFKPAPRKPLDTVLHIDSW
jgi:nitroreductase